VEHGFIDVSRAGMKTLDTKFKIHSRKLAAFCKHLPAVIHNVGGEIYEPLEHIRENGITKDILYEEDCRLLLAQILIKLLRVTNEEKRKVLSAKNFTPTRQLSPISEKIIQYVMAHCEELVDAGVLERELHYSYRYLSKYFHREMDMTPVQFAKSCKVLKAKEMLENTKMEIKNISEFLGYSDVHEFSRSFKKVTGVPPGHWKEIARSGICQDVVIHSGFENTLFIEKLPS
jgi:YesN/AraC family two-component response regulator